MLPRSQGTCTRCPFQITTSATPGDWKCVVSLRRDFAHDPMSVAQPGVQYPGWLTLATPQVVSFATLYSKVDLGPVLQAAQSAILNPQLDPHIFLGLSRQDQRVVDPAVKFSPNVITLEIEAPELPELSFYDLPGAINVHEDPSQQPLVKFGGL